MQFALDHNLDDHRKIEIAFLSILLINLYLNIDLPLPLPLNQIKPQQAVGINRLSRASLAPSEPSDQFVVGAVKLD